MKYIVSAVRKHVHSIKWKEMQAALDQLDKVGTPTKEVFWFEIDTNTHRAVSVFPSELSYREFEEKLGEMRKESSSDMNMSMTFEAHGLARVTKTDA